MALQRQYGPAAVLYSFFFYLSTPENSTIQHKMANLTNAHSDESITVRSDENSIVFVQRVRQYTD